MGSSPRSPAFAMTVSIREVARADIGAIVAIESASFGDPWTPGMFGSHLLSGGGNCFLVAEDNCGVVVGFAISRTVSDEAELLNIAVDPTCRKCGIGGRLLDVAVERSITAGALGMWLEVRASNVAARTLYEARGFAAVGLRKRYYEAPREDAIVLRTDLRRGLGIETVTRAELSLTAEPVEQILLPASHLPRQETK